MTQYIDVNPIVKDILKQHPESAAGFRELFLRVWGMDIKYSYPEHFPLQEEHGMTVDARTYNALTR